MSAPEAAAVGHEPIAIVGIGCRLPGGVHSPADFWELLREGRDAITEVPPERWSLAQHYHPDPQHPLTQHVRRGGFVEGIDHFDAAFFGISPREAVCMDPQQRMLLEVAWRAFEDGGVPPERLRGQPVGVFIGISSADYSSLLWASQEHYATPDNEPFVLPGNTGCIAANRLSYFFDLKGPSFTVDTACSSSLVAVHLACESLWRGESQAALAGGVQALIHPGIQMSFCKAGLLAPDGRCKSFDAAADGYVRSEGAGVVLLKPLRQAQADGDAIYALIHGTAVNSDGRSNGLVAPNARAQIACVREAFARAGIDPAATQYVEAHGTGTRQGDPLELRALGTVLGEGREEGRPCRVGSVKTNLGHSETAAGITGLIKAALAVHHRQLPPSLHFETPNPSIDFAGLKLQVQTQLEPFPQPGEAAVVGVSSFGFGGTNAHVVLAEAPQAPPPPRFGRQLPLQPVCLSAQSPQALQALAAAYLELLQRGPQGQLANLAATANRHRSHFRHRAVCLAASPSALQGQLQALAQGERAAGLIQGQRQRHRRKLAWLFTGQGSQALGMARGLLEHHPGFRSTLERLAVLLDPQLPRPLLQLLEPPSGEEEALAMALNQTGTTQPLLFAVGVALAELWLSWGLEPDLLLGHSVGEVIAAHVAGVLDLEDACRLISARGRLMQHLPPEGAMVAVLASEQQLQPLLLEAPGLTLAALNGPTNTVISGARTAMEPFVRRLEGLGLACQPLAVSHAFHSPAMEPMLAAFEQELRQLRFRPPRRALVSTVSGGLAGAEIASADYWCDQVLRPVRFADAVATLADHAVGTLLELGARPTLIGMARPLLADHELLALPSLVPGQPDWQVILTSLAQLHSRGHRVDWAAFHRPFQPRRVPLPGYPFQRQRYWWSAKGQAPGPASLWLDHLGLTTGSAGPLAPAPATGLQRLDLPGPEQRYELLLRASQPADLAHHAIRGQVVFPAAGFLEQALAVLVQAQRPLHLAGLRLDQPLKLRPEPARLQVVWDPQARCLQFHSRQGSDADGGWLAHGQVLAQAEAAAPPWRPEAVPPEAEPVDLEAFYGGLAARGLQYGPPFRQLSRLWRQPDRAWAELSRRAGGHDRGLLDSCFQAVAAALDPQAQRGQLLLPVGLEQLQLSRWPLPDQFSCEVRLQPSAELAFVQADLVLHQGGQTLGWITGFRLRRLPRQALEWLFPQPEPCQTAAGPEQWLHQSQWQPLDASVVALEGARPAGCALVGASEGQASGLRAWMREGVQAMAWGAAPPEGVTPVVLWPDVHAAVEAGTDLCSALLVRAQALAREATPRPVWLVLESDGASPEVQALAGALDAWVRTAALEQPQLAWTRLTLPRDPVLQPGPQDWPLIWAAAEAEAALAWRDQRLWVLRLQPLGPERHRWLSTHPGSLEALAQQPQPAPVLQAGELEIAVEATGLNFRDVLNALGLLAASAAELGAPEGASLPFGGEAVGRVVAVGPEVPEALVGQRVLAALAVGSLASHVVCRAELCLPLPASLSPEQGASLSTAFLTAVYGLETLAQLQAGETVLIHAAAGGVGQAALQVARRCGARILATASAAKQAALLEQGVEAVFDSRSTAFAQEVLAATGGRGVDVVLNSLKGPWVEASFQALAQGGRFVELGKIEIWSRQQAAERRPDARYLPFDLLEVAAAQPALIRHLLEQVLVDLQQGCLAPLPLQVFAEQRCVEAFRLMAQARHVGKLVISRGEQPAALRVRPDGTYLVSGALGALGQQLLTWLAQRGARSLLLVCRSAAQPPAEAQALLDRLAEQGVACRLLPVALGTAGDGVDAVAPLVAALGALPAGYPLRGVLHAAGVLDDGLIGGQTPDRLQAVLAPKASGWWQLERAVAAVGAPLDFAIAFSSMAALLGSPGQSSYGAANGALDGACGAGGGFGGTGAITLALQWGPWAGAGMAAGQGRRLAARGVRPLPPPAALEALGVALRRGRGGVLAVVDNDWPLLARQAPPRQAAAMRSLVEALPSGPGSGPGAGQPERQRICGLPAPERQAALVALLQHRLAAVMGLADASAIDPGDSLFQIGLDSLMAVELAASIHSDLGVKLELDSLAGDPSLDTLAALVLRGLERGDGRSGEAPLDLAQEAQLPPGWSLPPGPAASPPGEAILLTGGSGFLGAYLLAGQLHRWPALRPVVLVRAADGEQGAARLRHNLERYGLWQAAWGERIEALPGDLALPRFGLEPKAFADLAGRIGGILHNGAQLSQLAPYGQLAAANVGGTRTVLELAALARPLPVELISSVAVYEASAYRDQLLSEDDDLAEWQGIHIGYSQTKWVSERLVWAAAAAGLPVRVYRPPLIGGHSQSGLWHHDDLLHRLLRGCLELGLAPEIAWELDLVPVDYVADAVTALAWQPAEAGRCFHLHHPQPLLLGDLLGGLMARGAPLELVSMARWLEALERQPANPLYPIRGLFQRRWGEEQLTYPELNQAGVRARPASARTVAALAAVGVVCPPFEALIGPYARTFLGSLALG